MNRRKLLSSIGVVAGGTGTVIGGYRIWNKKTTWGSQDQPEEGTYYVSPDGDDSNSGSKDQPFRTVETAVDEVSPGETVYLRGGTYYHENPVRITDIEGTSENRITIAGYQNERPVFRFDGPYPGGWDSEGGLKFQNVHYLSIRNLVVRNSPHIGIYVGSGSSNNIFEDISTLYNNLVGIGFYQGATNNRIQNIHSSNNYDRQNGGRDGDGIQFSQTQDNTVVNSGFFYNSDDGLDLWESNSIEVRQCVSWNNGRGEEGGGNGFKLGGGDDSGDHRIVRNVAFHNSGIGFSHNGATSPITLYHNTAWRNPHNYSFYDIGHQLVNNIGSHGRVALGSSVEDDHNTWNLDIENPEFASYYPDDDYFLHLFEDSPCVNAGRDVGLNYTDEAPDLGAYEYTDR